MAERAAPRVASIGFTSTWRGLPTLVANYVGSDKEVAPVREKRIARYWPCISTEDANRADLINAGKQTITTPRVPRFFFFFFSSADLFGMIRRVR